jgi:hypothetical protein
MLIFETTLQSTPSLPWTTGRLPTESASVWGLRMSCLLVRASRHLLPCKRRALLGLHAETESQLVLRQFQAHCQLCAGLPKHSRGSSSWLAGVSPQAFAGRNGTHFTVDGHPYYFFGFNHPQLVRYAASNDSSQQAGPGIERRQLHTQRRMLLCFAPFAMYASPKLLRAWAVVTSSAFRAGKQQCSLGLGGAAPGAPCAGTLHMQRLPLRHLAAFQLPANTWARLCTEPSARMEAQGWKLALALLLKIGRFAAHSALPPSPNAGVLEEFVGPRKCLGHDRWPNLGRLRR